jgi:hypothetical protein
MMSGKKEDASLGVRRIDHPHSEPLLKMNEQQSKKKKD